MSSTPKIDELLEVTNQVYQKAKSDSVDVDYTLSMPANMELAVASDNKPVSYQQQFTKAKNKKSVTLIKNCDMMTHMYSFGPCNYTLQLQLFDGQGKECEYKNISLNLQNGWNEIPPIPVSHMYLVTSLYGEQTHALNKNYFLFREWILPQELRLITRSFGDAG